MYVIGTAGHVDHGKSTLVKSLTGIDPDRWEEEQRREMTIDLGFAWFTLPSGRSVSLIDVPGHERFIKNMLAGVSGFDAALLVVAADESLMPQTSEHLAILDLLQVRHGLVVISKADLVDGEWLELVQDEVRERLHGTSLEHAPVVAVSARSGQGLDLLRQQLDQLLDAIPSRTTGHGAPRLPIDRAFTIGGFGTVVTGTLVDGSLQIGDELELLPSGLKARVRGLQIHNQKTEQVLPGTRVAVNLAGIHHRAINRGDVLVPPGSLIPSDRLDLRLRLLHDAPGPISQNVALDLFSGASEVRCRVTLLDTERLEPGGEGWVQLRLSKPIAVARGDRAILRIASPSRTIAGGTIIDPHPPRHRRFRAEVLSGLEILVRGDPAELLLQALDDAPPQSREELASMSGLPVATMRPLAEQLATAGRLILLPAEGGTALHLVGVAVWQKLVDRLGATLRAYHGRFPLRRGISREELRQKLRLNPRSLGAFLDEALRRGLIGQDETAIWQADHDPQPGTEAAQALRIALAAMARSPYGPPPPDLDDELLAWALERRLFVRVAPEIFFLPATYDELLTWVQQTVVREGSVTVGGMRDRFGSSRKYALAFLEHLDERKVTRREGEGRVLV